MMAVCIGSDNSMPTKKSTTPLPPARSMMQPMASLIFFVLFKPMSLEMATLAPTERPMKRETMRLMTEALAPTAAIS